jgi:hypothetical protein
VGGPNTSCHFLGGGAISYQLSFFQDDQLKKHVLESFLPPLPYATHPENNAMTSAHQLFLPPEWQFYFVNYFYKTGSGSFTLV